MDSVVPQISFLNLTIAFIPVFLVLAFFIHWSLGTQKIIFAKLKTQSVEIKKKKTQTIMNKKNLTKKLNIKKL